MIIRLTGKVESFLEEGSLEKHNHDLRFPTGFLHRQAGLAPEPRERDITAFADGILQLAAESGASDIHLEPLDNKTRVRLRIDGILREAGEFSMAAHKAVLSRLKIMGGMDIAEQRLPQDGRTEIKAGGRRMDLRISTLPTIRGEKMVLRLLDRSSELLRLEHLDLSDANLKLYRSLYSAAHGMVLVAGPTGSGKSTALYATLREISTAEKNIVTVEDPVEYRLEGINQTAVNKKAGLLFANILRSVLRQDPNVIMIGEIRDRETAAIAVQAALTGHLVFSTLHTGSGAGAVTRLLDMGVEPFLLAACLRGVLAQRLVRRLCPCCRESYGAGAAELACLGRESGEPVLLYRGRGCEHCGNSGYNGRMAVQEVLAVTEETRAVILAGGTAGQIAATGAATGMHSLWEDGVAKVLRGDTSLEELVRAAAY